MCYGKVAQTLHSFSEVENLRENVSDKRLEGVVHVFYAGVSLGCKLIARAHDTNRPCCGSPKNSRRYRYEKVG
jgi:hypothetical protein